MSNRGMTICKRRCPFCRTEYDLEVEANQLRMYLEGMRVQDAFKDKDTTFREKVLTGMCDKCQKETFGE